jgi:hypothetical protein
MSTGHQLVFCFGWTYRCSAAHAPYCGANMSAVGKVCVSCASHYGDLVRCCCVNATKIEG